MSERPIIFSAPMVRAILDGRKTQTRRICKPIMAWEKQHVREARFWNGGWHEFFIGADIPYAELVCRHGRRGDRLWVRENFAFVGGGDPGLLLCQADWQETAKLHKCDNADKPPRWKPSIHMPRWASRITLEITGIRVERLQDISENDAVAEGVEFWTPTVDVDPVPSPRPAYRLLWESINGAGSWGLNPWVFVIEFKRVTP